MFPKIKQFLGMGGGAPADAAPSPTLTDDPVALLTADQAPPPSIDLRAWEREEVVRLTRLVDESQSGQTTISLDGFKTIRESWTNAGRKYLGDHWDRQPREGVKLVTLNKTQNVVKTHLAFEVEQPAHVHFDPLFDDGREIAFLTAKAGRKLGRMLGGAVMGLFTPGQLAGVEPLSEDQYEEMTEGGAPVAPPGPAPAAPAAMAGDGGMQVPGSDQAAAPTLPQSTDRPIDGSTAPGAAVGGSGGQEGGQAPIGSADSTNGSQTPPLPRLTDDDFTIINARTKSERVQAMWDDKWDSSRGEFFRLENALLANIFGHCPWHFWYDQEEHKFCFENRHVCMVFPPTTQTEIGRFDYLLLRQWVPRDQMILEHPEWKAELEEASDRFGGATAGVSGIGSVTRFGAEGERVSSAFRQGLNVTFDREGFAYAVTDWQRGMVRVLTAWERYARFPLTTEEALKQGLVSFEPFSRQDALGQGLIAPDLEQRFHVAFGEPGNEAEQLGGDDGGSTGQVPSPQPSPGGRGSQMPYDGPRHQQEDGSWHSGDTHDEVSVPLQVQSTLRGYVHPESGEQALHPGDDPAYRQQQSQSNWPGRWVVAATGEDTDPGEPGEGEPGKESGVRGQESGDPGAGNPGARAGKAPGGSPVARGSWFPKPHWEKAPAENWPTKACIRQVQVLEDNQRIIEDVPCPYADIPFAWNRATLIPWSPYGIGDPMGLESLQDFANRLATYIFHQVRMNAYGQEYLPEELKAALVAQGINAHSTPDSAVGVDAETFKEFVLPLLAAGQNFAMKPAQPTADAIGLLFRVLGLMDDIGQHADVMQGKAPTANSSGELTKILTSNAGGPTALKGRMADWSLQRMGEISLQAMIQFMEADKKERARYLADLPPAVQEAMWVAIAATNWKVTVEQRGASKLLNEQKAEGQLKIGAISMETYRGNVGINNAIEKRRLAAQADQAAQAARGAMPGGEQMAAAAVQGNQSLMHAPGGQ